MCKYCDHVVKGDIYKPLSQVEVVTKAMHEHKENGTYNDRVLTMNIGLCGMTTDPDNQPSLSCSLYLGQGMTDLIDDPIPIRFCPMCGAPLRNNAIEGDYWLDYINRYHNLELKNKALKERLNSIYSYSKQEHKEENDRCHCDSECSRDKVLKEMRESFKYKSKEDKKSEELLKETEKFYETLDKIFEEVFLGEVKGDHEA